MFTEDIAEKVLMNPLREGADELYVAASYATHTMLSWFLTNLELHQHQTLRIAIMIGMVPYNHLSVTVHDGFCALVRQPYPPQVERVQLLVRLSCVSWKSVCMEEKWRTF